MAASKTGPLQSSYLVLNFHHTIYLKITNYVHCFFIYREEPSAVNNNNTANFTSGKPLVLQMPPPAANSSFSSAAAAQLAVPSPPHLSTPPPKIRSTSPGPCKLNYVKISAKKKESAAEIGPEVEVTKIIRR
jgi:hypothetical protein